MKNLLNRKDPKSLTITASIVAVALGLGIGVTAIVTHQNANNDNDVVTQEVTQVATVIDAWAKADKDGNKIPLNANSGAVKNNKAWNVVSGSNVSKNVTWSVSGDANGYCIKGYSQKGGEYPIASPLTYDSRDGGLGKSAGACSGLSDVTSVGSLVSAPVTFKSAGTASFEAVASAVTVNDRASINFAGIGDNVGAYVITGYTCSDGKAHAYGQEGGVEMVALPTGGIVQSVDGCKVVTVTIAPVAIIDESGLNLVGEHVLEVTNA